MSILNELELYENNLKDALNSNEIYEILDGCDVTYGSTPCAGGCAIIAFALSKYFNYPIYVLYNEDKGVVEHFVVKTDNDIYIDCDGEQDDIISAFKKRENIDANIKLLPYKKDMNIGDIVIDEEAIDNMVNYFKGINL